MRIDPTRLVHSLCTLMRDEGYWQFSLTSPYSENRNKPAAFFGGMPTDPHTAVTVRVYDEDTSRDDHNPDIFVQLRFRAAGKDIRAVEDLADKAFQRLHWPAEHQPEVWPPRGWPDSVHVLMSRRVVRGIAGQDANERWERADSYRFTINPGGSNG